MSSSPPYLAIINLLVDKYKCNNIVQERLNSPLSADMADS
jgi:hypothetical protein